MKFDYIGGIVDGEVRGEKIANARAAIHNQHKGLFSRENSTNWRYIATQNVLFFNIPANENSKELVIDFLRKRGIVNVKIKSMYY